MSSTIKKKDQPLKIDSDDTEGSDLSYESSFDEKGESEQIEDKQRNLQLFKEQMVRFLLTHPELSDEIKFDNLIYEEDNKNTKSNIFDKQESNQPYNNPLWQSVANNLIQESKRGSSMPSIESFSQRLNLFRRKVEKPDIIDIIIQNKNTLLQQIQKEQERKAKQQNKIHKTIEAKLRKETGDVVYYSLRKKYEFQFRMKQEENRQNLIYQNNADKEKNSSNNQKSGQRQNTSESNIPASQINQQSQNITQNNDPNNRRSLSQKLNQQHNNIMQNKKKKRQGPSVFDRLGGKKIEEEKEKEQPLDMEFKTDKGEELYRLIQKKDNDEDKKRAVIQFLIDHREKTRVEFQSKNSLLSQGQKYYSEESKEFSLLAPNQGTKQHIKESGIIDDDFFENRSNLEDGNVYLLTKVNKILNGSLMKKWKEIQDSQF